MSANPTEINHNLVYAAGEGDLKTVQDLVTNKGADLCYTCNKSELNAYVTALAWAAYRGKLEVVQWILSQPVGQKSCEMVDDSLSTVLHHAVRSESLIRRQNMSIIKLIYQSYPHAIKLADHSGNTPLHLAALWGSLECLVFLLAQDKNANRPNKRKNNLLHMADSNPQNFAFLLKKFPESRFDTNAEGLTPLLSAARNFDEYDSVSVMLNHFPELVEQRGPDDSTVLHKVVELMVRANKLENETATLNFILDRFPEASALIDNHGQTAIQVAKSYAAYDGRDRAFTVIKHLLGLGADVQDVRVHVTNDIEYLFRIVQARYQQDTPLKDKLTEQEEKSIAECGLTINARSRQENGDTVLHIAVRHKDRVLVLKLLLQGARVDLQNHDEHTAFDLAVASKDPFLVALVSIFRGKQLHRRLEEEYAEYRDRNSRAVSKERVESKDSKESKEIHENVEREIQEYFEWENKQQLKRIEKILQEFLPLLPEIRNFKKYLVIVPTERQGEVVLYLAKLLAPVDVHNELLPVVSGGLALTAYEVLRKVPENSPFYPAAQHRMHALLIKELVLVPEKLLQKDLAKEAVGVAQDGIKPVIRAAIFPEEKVKHETAAMVSESKAVFETKVLVEKGTVAETKVRKEKEVTGLEEEDKSENSLPTPLSPKEEILKLSLKYKIVHLLASDYQAKELLVMYIAEFLAGPQFAFASEKGKEKRALADKVYQEILNKKYYQSPQAVLKILESYANEDLQRVLLENLELRKKVTSLETDKQALAADKENLLADKQALIKQLEEMRERLSRAQGEVAGSQSNGLNFSGNPGVTVAAAATALASDSVARAPKSKKAMN